MSSFQQNTFTICLFLQFVLNKFLPRFPLDSVFTGFHKIKIAKNEVIIQLAEAVY